MLRKLILKLMALAFVMGVTMTPAMAGSHEHDSDHKAFKYEKKEKHEKKLKYERANEHDQEKYEKEDTEIEKHNKHPERY
ncbi:MAG TPA: hypothetical protein VKA23_01745 [Mariprofundaceae bacterium]|nr:hypothetical protein [Mariprofundaceae bacterium]